jgi:hypothetical protein
MFVEEESTSVEESKELVVRHLELFRAYFAGLLLLRRCPVALPLVFERQVSDSERPQLLHQEPC